MKKRQEKPAEPKGAKFSKVSARIRVAPKSASSRVSAASKKPSARIRAVPKSSSSRVRAEPKKASVRIRAAPKGVGARIKAVPKKARRVVTGRKRGAVSEVRKLATSHRVEGSGSRRTKSADSKRGIFSDPKKGVILVSGSAGRIGASLVKALGDDYHIVGFELMSALYASANEELVPVDVSSPESVAQAFRHIEDFYGSKIISVVHLAAYYSFKDQKYKKYKKITVEGTRNILKALQQFDVEQFIFSSTMLVHKPQNPGKKINESSPKAGKWAYPKSKIETEEVIHKHRGKIPTVILRISGVYDDLCHSIPISNQIQRIYEKQLASHFFPGDISHGASFMHMDDLVDVLLKAIEKRKSLPKETTLLIGDSETLSTDQLQRQISDSLFGRKMKTYWMPKSLAWLGVKMQSMIPWEQSSFIQPWMVKLANDNYTLDLSKAKKVLGWEPKHHLSSDLDVILKNMKKDPEAWYKINGLHPSKHLRHVWKKNKKHNQDERQSVNY